ncbi:MAG: Glu/Leu/Phe/Val dehydrogenase dimerization domain-containing protein [Desulfobulbaceae bacterium]|nr:Glu/Leu/Phe/Val dehydrogenase dimerization domain-containing protein [Desulfobulbaceae bacterium]
MPQNNDKQPFIFEYTDPDEQFKGWLVIDGSENSLCAGGMRVQPGLNREHVIAMARNMTMKMRICGLPIDGAKCGIDYLPEAPGKQAAMTRFMAAIKPHIEERYSMGPDLNTTMDELEEIAHALGIPSIKMAIAKAQGLDIPSFLARYAVLSQLAIGTWALGRLRAGFGVAMAATATLHWLGLPVKGARITVQGFGNLAKAAIIALCEAGATINAIADAEKCFVVEPGQELPLRELLSRPGTLLPTLPDSSVFRIEEKQAILSQECDLLILAAVENVVTKENADIIKAKAIIPGANLAITPEGEEVLFARGVVALPSFVAGCGGSLSMNGLFGPRQTPSPHRVLVYIKQAMSAIVQKILAKSSVEHINPTQAATLICQSERPSAKGRPYSIEEASSASPSPP